MVTEAATRHQSSYKWQPSSPPTGKVTAIRAGVSLQDLSFGCVRSPSPINSWCPCCCLWARSSAWRPGNYRPAGLRAAAQQRERVCVWVSECVWEGVCVGVCECVLACVWAWRSVCVCVCVWDWETKSVCELVCTGTCKQMCMCEKRCVCGTVFVCVPMYICVCVTCTHMLLFPWFPFAFPKLLSQE